MGDDYYNQGLYDDAILEFKEAIKSEEHRAVNYNRLGNAYAIIGEYDDAKREHGRAVVLDKENAQYHGDLGMTLYLQKDYERALSEYQKAEEYSTTVEARAEFRKRIDEIVQEADIAD